MHLGQFHNLGRIGEGTYGVVLKCQHKITGQLVAIKKFKDTEDDEQVRKTALREVKLLQNLRHDNIVRLLEFFRVHRKLFLVFEYVEGTVLQELERSPSGLGDLATRRIMWQLVQATQHLHASKIVHRDIKPENMLLSTSGLLKLCDFGFARYLSAPSIPGDMSDYVATRWYRAPELLVGDRSYGPAVDVWAIGCMLIEMQTGQPLFPGNSDIDQLWHILKSFTEEQLDELMSNPMFQHMSVPAPSERRTLEQRFPNLPPETHAFLRACLQPNPAKRETCWRLLQSQYFAGAPSWFPRNFFPSAAAEKVIVRQAMSVERQRGKARRPKRKADARSSFMAQALNISPCRDRRAQESSVGCQPRQQPSGLDLACSESPSDLRQGAASDAESGDVVEPSCSVTLPKEGRSKAGTVLVLDARAGTPSEDMAAADECMVDAPLISQAASQPLDEPGNEPATMQMRRRRSQRLQGPHSERHTPPKWQGFEGRSGAPFLSPEPRGLRQREKRQPMIPEKQNSPSPARQHVPNTSRQSPLKGTWRDAAWPMGPAHRGRGRGTPQPSRASMDVAMASCDDSPHPGIPAHYGIGRQAGESGQEGQHPWVQRGWVSFGQPIPHRFQGHQSPAPGSTQRWAAQGANNFALSPSDSGASQHRSPLRAHAAPFVPQALQGRRAEIHQHSPHAEAQ